MDVLKTRAVIEEGLARTGRTAPESIVAHPTTVRGSFAGKPDVARVKQDRRRHSRPGRSVGLDCRHIADLRVRRNLR